MLHATVLLFTLVIAGCGGGTSTPPSTSDEEQPELRVAAASGLALAFAELGERFEEETGTKVTFTFGSTGQLADQIENGAPFDVFAAANRGFIENLDENNLLISETLQTYAFGRIGLATTVHAPGVETPGDLLLPEVERIAIANPAHAPYGLAAKQALQSAGVYEEIESKLVYGRNITDTLNYIETGNAEVAIIARSLTDEDSVNFYELDEELHEPIEQTIAVIERTEKEPLASDFIAFIFGPVGTPIMESYGYMIPE
ncbi:molybdate ABC transporter substrate-binding protein [Desertibacillus haloalkaliphilus]|nr:molybdate ABC transporter substrate-binding protein [Desertibacillus haloalkaliphilus]